MAVYASNMGMLYNFTNKQWGLFLSQVSDDKEIHEIIKDIKPIILGACKDVTAWTEEDAADEASLFYKDNSLSSAAIMKAVKEQRDARTR